MPQGQRRSGGRGGGAHAKWELNKPQLLLLRKPSLPGHLLKVRWRYERSRLRHGSAQRRRCGRVCQKTAVATELCSQVFARTGPSAQRLNLLRPLLVTLGEGKRGAFAASCRELELPVAAAFAPPKPDALFGRLPFAHTLPLPYVPPFAMGSDSESGSGRARRRPRRQATPEEDRGARREREERRDEPRERAGGGDDRRRDGGEGRRDDRRGERDRGGEGRRRGDDDRGRLGRDEGVPRRDDPEVARKGRGFGNGEAAGRGEGAGDEGLPSEPRERKALPVADTKTGGCASDWGVHGVLLAHLPTPIAHQNRQQRSQPRYQTWLT